MFIYDMGVHEDVREDEDDVIDDALGALPSQDHEKF